LEKLLQWDPAKRPSAAEALSHPYFDDIRDADFEQVWTEKKKGSEGSPTYTFRRNEGFELQTHNSSKTK
jgi:serine/threonine protein kinase